MRRFVLYIALIFLFAQCNKPDAPDCFKKAGSRITVDRQLDSFYRIELNDFIILKLVEDSSSTFARISANENLTDKIVTEVNGGVLTIDNENTCRFVRSFKNRIEIELHEAGISEIINFGQGDISTENQLKTDVLFYEQNHGVGDVTLDVEADSVSVICHTGIGNVKVTGTTQAVGIYNGGYGFIDTSELTANRAFVNNSSINDVKVKFSDYMFALIGRSGNIFYDGPLEVVSLSNQGSGELIPID